MWEYRDLFVVMILLTVGRLPEVRLLAHTVALFLISWRTSILFSRVTAPVYISTNNAWGSPCSTSKNTYLLDSLIIAICKNEVASHWGFQVHLSQMIKNVELFYSCTCWPFVCLIWVKKSLLMSFAYFLLLLSYMIFLYIWLLTPYRMYNLHIFSPIQLVVFVSFYFFLIVCFSVQKLFV